MDCVIANRTVDNSLWQKGEIPNFLRFVLESFPKANPVLIVGGALRDLFVDPPKKPKDIDITIGKISRANLQKLEGVTLNFFGGVTLQRFGLSADLWPLKDTYHIKQFGWPPSISSFLAGAPFNLDKIAYDIRERQFFDDGCLAGIRRQRIVYAPKIAYLEPIQAARCILLQKKTRFLLDHSARSLLQRAAGVLRQDPAAATSVRRYLKYLKSFYDDNVADAVIKAILEPSDESEVINEV
jgi:hypothetical protein